MLGEVGREPREEYAYARKAECAGVGEVAGVEDGQYIAHAAVARNKRTALPAGAIENVEERVHIVVVPCASRGSG